MLNITARKNLIAEYYSPREITIVKRFNQHLKEARNRAKLSQRVLAERVGIKDSYISRMETGAFRSPSREVTVKLADALGIRGKPVPLYLSKKDVATLERFVFFLAAYVAGAEDVQEIRLAECEENVPDDGEEQENSTPTYNAAHPAISIPSLRSSTIGGRIEHLIAAAGPSEEEEKELGAELIEITKWRLAYIETQRKMQKEG
jgi:transcriptional regulator with XRE-family HTH domain